MLICKQYIDSHTNEMLSDYLRKFVMALHIGSCFDS